MVHFQHRVIEGQAFHPVFQLFVKDHAALVQVLVVDTYGQHEVAEDVFRYAVAPRHFDPCTERTADVVEVELSVIVRDIPDRHIGVQECERLFFIGRHLLVKDGKQVSVGQGGLLCLEILFDFGTERVVRNEMLLSVA